MECVTLCLYEQSERWGDHKILRPLYRGIANFYTLLIGGIANFARFFRPPPPIVNELPLNPNLADPTLQHTFTMIITGHG